MVANRTDHRKGQPASTAPLQPQGWPINAHTNIANQARQAAERERVRVEQLTRRNRRLRTVVGVGLTATGIGMTTAFALGGIVGYAFGAGLLGLAGR